MRIQLKLITALLAAVVTPFLHAGDGRIPIASAPYTISAPGVYYLTQDLTVASGTAVTISTGNVTLDLNGHTLTNSFNGGLNYCITGASGGYAGLRVTNGRVVGGGTGIALTGGSGALLQVDHIESLNAGITGIVLNGNGTVAFTADISSVRVSGAATNAGINVNGASGGRISGNTVQYGSNGIQIDNSRGLLVEHNAVSDSGQNGIYLSSNSSRDNFITGNTVQKAFSTGILVSGARGNRITFNVISYNSVGVTLLNTNNNTVSDNTLVENSSLGLQMGASSNTLVTRNSIMGTQGLGDGIYLYNICRFNSFDSNFSTGNVRYGINFSDVNSTGNVYSNNRFLNNVSGNIFGAGNFSGGGNNTGGANF